MLPVSQSLILIKKYFKSFVLLDRRCIYNMILEMTKMLRVISPNNTFSFITKYNISNFRLCIKTMTLGTMQRYSIIA